MMAYIVMMTIRLLELHRVLKKTGILYLHCDSTASHYMKIVLDTIFGPENFRNEIIWKRSQPKSHVTLRLSRAHDTLLVFAKSPLATFHLQYIAHNRAYVDKFYRHREPETGRRYRLGDVTNLNKDRPNLTYEFPPGSGTVRVWRWTKERMLKAWEEGRVVLPEQGKVVAQKRYLDEMEGTPLADVWDDIEHLHGLQQETLGYPTQKPLALLERIIHTSSNPGDVVLDPFCGCGTALVAAQKLERRWLGIDLTHVSIALQKYRLAAMFPGIPFDVRGEPRDYGAARKLAQDDRHQFQWWALSLVRARPLGGQEEGTRGKKGSEKGIDGVIPFCDDHTNTTKQVIVQVKSGPVKAGDVRAFIATITREQTAIGVLITLDNPACDLVSEARTAGFYHSDGWNKDYPRIQILPIAELLQGTAVQMPPPGTFKQAHKGKKW
jgi:site-specific DNA-methyltransferase (adenine-specific)